MRSLPALLLLLSAAPDQALACELEGGQVQEANLYYELDSSTLSAMGRGTLERVVGQSRGCEVLFVVAGHVDASELESNPGLSQARIEDVRARLLAHGIAQEDIVVRDMKFNSPALPTRPGVREPLNRRAGLVVVVF